MQVVGFDVEDCKKSLNSYATEVAELMALIEEPNKITREVADEARERLTNLKSCLKRDYALRNTVAAQKKMTEVEEAIYFPAVHQAFADLRIRANSRPNGEWYSELYGIQITINHALSDLKQWGK